MANDFINSFRYENMTLANVQADGEISSELLVRKIEQPQSECKNQYAGISKVLPEVVVGKSREPGCDINERNDTKPERSARNSQGVRPAAAGVSYRYFGSSTLVRIAKKSPDNQVDNENGLRKIKVHEAG